MKKKYKLPYGVSNFSKLIKEGYFFIDRTEYIEHLEQLGEPYLFFLRPRRFGKTLLLSVLQHYYGKEHKNDFDELFGNYYIGKKPTLNAGKYLVLKFDFSSINTENKETTFADFLRAVKVGILEMMSRYPEFFDKEDQEKIETYTAPNNMLSGLLLLFEQKRIKEKIYLLIDEYDHFTNELLAFRLLEFKEIVSQNGFVRKFFEMLKQGAGKGVVDRIFVTGVSPITLDSLTSGFNIAMNISRDFRFAEMTGFTEMEIVALLNVARPESEFHQAGILPKLADWYNGYRFSANMKTGIYNPGMILFFCVKFQELNDFPEVMLDTNLASDYGKIRRMFDIENPERNYEVLQKIVETREVSAAITEQFSFEIPFSRDNFVSLLYYMGLLTIVSSWAGIYKFKIPNFVIERLFYDYFLHLLEKREELPVETKILQESMREMALGNNPRPFFGYVQSLLQHLSNRDYREFSEKHLKVIIFTLALQTDAYFVKSEREVKGGYTDLQFIAQPAVPVNSEYVFELKYLPKKDAHQLKHAQKEAGEQLLNYINNDPELKDLKTLKGWTVVVVKDEVHLEKVFGAAD